MMSNKEFSCKGHNSLTKVGSLITDQALKTTKPVNNIFKNKSCCSGSRVISNNLRFSPLSQVIGYSNYVSYLLMLGRRIYQTDEINDPFLKGLQCFDRV
jgi:hypothetical protein